ncbi:MAG: hypothetical protein RIS64_3970, partial [Bacteroidota bacterium]
LKNEVSYSDTVTLIHIQKLILGTVVKHYPVPCPPETEEQRALKLHYDHCVIAFFHPARFELRLPDSVPSPLKCEVYYSLNGVRKVTYHSKVDTMSCIIASRRGTYSEPGDPCIWVIGEHN